MTDLGLRRLFRPPTDHLSVEEQLRLCPTRDLSKTKLFRTAAKIWGEPQRKRVVIAPPMLTCKEKEPKSDESACFREKRDGDTPDVDDYRTWMEERKKLRRGLEGLHLNDDWLRAKSSKSELEKRVMGRMREQKLRDKNKSEEETSPLPVTPQVKERSRSRKGYHLNPPSLDLPVPEAMIIIEKFIEENRLRLIDLFTQFDKNKDWHISETEFRNAFHLAKIPVQDDQLDNLISALDRDDDGLLDYRELVRGRKSLQAITREKRRESRQKNDESPSQSPININNTNRTSSVNSVGGGSPAISPVDNRKSCQSGMSHLEVPRVSLTETITDDQRSELKARAKAQKQKQQRAKQMKLRQGKVDDARRTVVVPRRVERHLAPSTLSGSPGEMINEMRKQSKREYDKAVNLCRMHGVKLTRELLEKVLLYPGDRSVKECKSGLLHPQSSCLSCNYTPASDADAPVDVRRFKLNLSYPNDMCLSSSASSVKLATGEAVIHPKTDCWLTDREYEGLTRHLTRRYTQLHPGRDAFWPGSMLDRLRLFMPHTPGMPQKKTHSVDNVFHPIVRPLTNRDSLRSHYLRSELWPINNAGYVQHGSRQYRKQYQL